MDADLPEPPEVELTTRAEAELDEKQPEEDAGDEVEKGVQHATHSHGTNDYKLK